ncbi:MAG: ATP-binding protein [Oscillospiraceae bacterium]|jgi:sigma-B regulation protein RsbU (phosphoserine phosphatase)|nr:ATP-binding protein [Oscillospiraceae bacterium]
MKEITVVAKKEELDKILDFSHDILQQRECDKKTILNLDLIIEEIFVNIASYSYPDEEGVLIVKCEINEKTKMFVIEFIDNGIKFNPLEKIDPDVKLSANDRKTGGLGIFISKKLADEISYCYKENKNHLLIKKKL